MACGTPVIVTDVGDMTDAVHDGFNALVIKRFDNIEAFGDAIVRFDL